MMTFCFCMVVFPYKTMAQFAGGDGTESNPYQIATAEQLAQMAILINQGKKVYNDKFYELVANIDISAYNASNADFNNGKGWIPIGIEGSSFYGTFNGNYHIINGLYINDSVRDKVGLFGSFGYLRGRIKNVGIENVNVRGHHNVGGLVGYLYDGGSITNCYSQGIVKGDFAVGGIVGNNGGFIRNCYSTGIVNGNQAIGGLAGWVSNGVTVANCYSTSVVSGNSYVGGLVGSNVGTIKDCAAINASVTLTTDKRVTDSRTGVITLIGRVEGDGRSLNRNNIALDEMLNADGNTEWHNKGANYHDGQDITIKEINADGTLGGRFTEENGWIVEDGNLPKLNNK